MLGLTIDPFAYTVPGSLPPYTDTTGRTAISAALDPVKRNFIAIIEGQSLASNHIPTAYNIQNPTQVNCVNWAGDRLLYQHKEPMFGGTFYSAGEIPGNNWNAPYISLWGKVGDLLINSGTFDRVIWLNVSSGGQKVADFAPGGVIYQRIPNAFHILQSLGIIGSKVSAILSMIGESDGTLNTPPDQYKAYRRAAMRVSRSYGFTGPWVTPVETYTHAIISASIAQAQTELGAEGGFKPGPIFDTLGAGYRDSGGTHQNALGHDTMAQMWHDNIRANFVVSASSVRRLHYA